jgi:hypothetical protein
MYRKIGLFVCVWALVWSLGCSVYADTTIKTNMAKTIEILSPEVGSEGDVILKKDTLFVKLRLTGKTPVYMSLYRIDPEFYIGSEPKSDVTFVPNDDFDNLTEEQKQEYRRDVFYKKNRLEAAYNISLEEYNAALSAVRKEFGDVAKMDALKDSAGLNLVQTAIYDNYRNAYGDYVQKKKEYTTVKTRYDKLFTRLIHGPVEVKPTEIFMTYQTEIPGVKSGIYVLAFSENGDGTGIVKTLEFKGSTSEKAVEQMLNSIPASRSIIFN